MRRYRIGLLSMVLALVSAGSYAVTCNSQGAYADGFNDAQQGYIMQNNYAASCGGNVDQLNQDYMNGYQAAMHSGAHNALQPANSANSGSTQPQQECVTSGNGSKKACGYNCVTTETGAQCAPNSDEMCLADQQGDKIACGYNCAASLTSVACASTAAQSCLVDTNTTTVVCGDNCQNQYGTVQCSDVTN